MGEGALLEEAQQLGDDLARALRSGFGEVKGAVGDSRVLLGDLLGLADVGLAHLQEAPAPGQELQGGVDELAGEGVEDDVDSLAVGGL